MTMTLNSMKTKSIALLTAMTLAAPAAFAESPQRATTEGEPVASEQQFVYDVESPRINNGMAEFDAQTIAMSQETFRAIANSRGEMMKTTAGEEIGMITEVGTNAQGNPEMVVDVKDDSPIRADELVITVTPGNVKLMDQAIMLDTTLDALAIKATKNGVNSGDDSVSVTLF
ncbi:hypothetical protein [Lentibacter sp. XHP0401]|uniref:hypothetical protein n=1 Tax=Lentibacter sp. XHP0401 TaxID=2984334 RepID=UPI0021E71755|nr:hypothetical protein [Lentibacter sp. XHP0401]MCV2893395.1 hypothetical protein [Lentibacter sp. XHP0401]